MSNIDKQALVIPQRERHDWSQAVMRNCDFCQQWALTVRHSDGGCICASCCDSEYTTALSSALVVALDELEAKDNRINRLEAIVDVAEQRNALMREWKRALKVPCDLVDDQVPVVIHGMVTRLDRLKETEEKLEDAEKKTVEMPTFDGYVSYVARELQAAFRIACDNAGINIAAAGKGEAS